MNRFCSLLAALICWVHGACAEPVTPAQREAVYQQMLGFRNLVRGGSIVPQWMPDGRSFWYAEGQPANLTIMKMDPAENRVEPLFDTVRLRRALRSQLGHEPPHQGVPFQTFDVVDSRHVRFVVEGRSFQLDLASYELASAEPAVPKPRAAPAAPVVYLYGSREVPSPSGELTALFDNYNLWLRSQPGKPPVQLTSDGTDRLAWSLRAFSWNPQGTALFVTRVDWRNVPFMPIVDWSQPNQEVITYSPFPPTGDADVERTDLFVIDAGSGHRIRIDTGTEPGQQIWPIGWRRGGAEVMFLRADQMMKRLDLMAADPHTGHARVLLTERQKTFIERITPITDNLYYPIDDGARFIWRSERDGWSHLYLYDQDGKLLRRLTSGQGPVESVAAIDDRRGWVYYYASIDHDRPYDVHLYRVGLDGKRSQRLTEASGVHSVQFAPGKEYFLDTHSTVARPPSVDFRASDGRLIRELAKADIAELQALGWREPEEFRVKAADGATDLFGVLYKPFDFDPARRYPVIDLEYPGNFTHMTPRTFVGTWLGDEAQALTQLGFIVYIVDGRGTTGRGKAFQDFTYGGLGRIEVPDHVATLRQLAAERPYMDTSRVGVTGYSWGGYLAIRAMLTAPDVFKVGVAGAPVVDLFAEPALGLPRENVAAYREASNLPIVDRLQGKLLVTIGTSDPGAMFGATMRLADAFIKAGKFFDLIIFPGEQHGLSPTAMAYYIDARNRYFVEHLQP